MKLNEKRILYLAFALLIVAVIVALIVIFNHKQVTCTNVSNQTKNGYVYETKYIIKSSGNIVDTINIKETVTSDDSEKLSNFKKQFDEQYEYNKKNYGGFDYTIKQKNNKVTTDININYKEFNMKKFIKNNVAMKKYTKNNKLTLDGAKKMYESSGATCK